MAKTMEALGMIEAKGLITLIEASDAMIKAVGDAVTIASDSPAAALASLRQLHDVTRRIEGFRCYVPASVRVPW